MICKGGFESHRRATNSKGNNMAKKKPFSKKQLERAKRKEEQKLADRAARKLWRQTATDEEKAECKAANALAYDRQKHREQSAKHHRVTRCYVYIAENTVTGEIKAYNGKKGVWSSQHVSVYESCRYNKWAASPEVLLARLKTHIKNTKDKENRKFYMVRAGSKNCPIKINYQESYDQHGHLLINELSFIVKK